MLATQAVSRWRVTGTHSANVLRLLTVLSMAIVFGLLALGAAVLRDARADAWWQAEQASSNLALALERDIARNISVYDLSLQGAADALRKPGIAEASPEIRHAAVFGPAASAAYLGSLLILDEKGDIVADSTAMEPHQLNLSDRDYFQIHRNRTDAGLYVSRPFHSRLRDHDASIAVSRRISGPDGEFRGVIMGAIRLAYFEHLFERLDIGSEGSVTLSRMDGRVIARRPLHDADFDLDISASDTFRHTRAASSGQFVSLSGIDGVERLFTFRSIDGFPLILNVAVSMNDVYAAWWRKALVIGSILGILCGTTIALCLLFRREMLRRMAAEAALTDTAEKLSVMAATDEMTGLANRRAFEGELAREWKRAVRAQTSMALLMLDADYFKLYNDHYGHQGGDQVLREISACISQAIRRPADVAARYGGEEFMALLPETELPAALKIAERICKAVASLRIAHAGSPIGHVTASIGVAAKCPQLGDAAALLLTMADMALYEAKGGGRNRVSVADHDHPPFLAWTPAPVDAARPDVVLGGPAA